MAGDEGQSYQLSSENDWVGFWAALNREPAKAKVLEMIEIRRAAAECYFKSAGLFDGVPWAIVDLGWYLNCQMSLRRLLKRFRFEREIKGYDLALMNDRNTLAKAGRSEAVFYQKPSGFPAMDESSVILSHQIVIEHLIGCADHPSVRHYQKVGNGPEAKPCFRAPEDGVSREFSALMQSEVAEFMEKSKGLAKDLKNSADCRNLLASLSKKFLCAPTERSARAVMGVTVAIDQNGFEYVPLVKKLGGAWAQYAFLKNLRGSRIKPNFCVWLEGTASAIYPSVRRLAEIDRRLSLFCGRIMACFKQLLGRMY